MLKKIWLCGFLGAALGAASLPPVLAGEVILAANGMSLPRDFSCGDAKKVPAGKYDLEVSYDTKPTAHSTLRIAKDGKSLCSVEGSGTSQHDKMSTSKTRLFTRFDADRKATEIIVITPTGMRDKVRNQIFYLPLDEAP